MVTHSNILAWRIPWAEEPWATVHRVAESDITEGTNSFTLRNSPRIKRDNTDKGVDSSRSITILNIYVLHSTSGSAGKESTCNVGDLDSIPRLGRYPGGGHDNTLQYSCLENPHGQRNLVGYSPWGHKDSDMTDWLSTHTYYSGQ